jgi:hypothetical protein
MNGGWVEISGWNIWVWCAEERRWNKIEELTGAGQNNFFITWEHGVCWEGFENNCGRRRRRACGEWSVGGRSEKLDEEEKSIFSFYVLLELK